MDSLLINFLFQLPLYFKKTFPSLQLNGAPFYLLDGMLLNDKSISKVH